MSVENRLGAFSSEDEEALRKVGLIKYSFPEIDFRRVTLPNIEREILWLREHVEEGTIGEQVLVQKAVQVYIDLRPCPTFLQPYLQDEDFLGRIISELRRSDKIARVIDKWGKSGEHFVLPESSRFGVTVDEITELVIPWVKELLKIDGHFRLPTTTELLFLRSNMKIFPDLPSGDYSMQTREWTNDRYLSSEGKELGHIFVSGRNDEFRSSGVRWWFTEGSDNRLPSLGFRLVAVPWAD